MTKKILALSLLICLAGCTAKPATKPQPPTTPKKTHRAVFTREYRRLWYNVDAQGAPHTYRFTKNAVIYDRIKTPVYWANERSKADNQILDAAQQPETPKANWAAANTYAGWLNLRGWYQKNGSGTSFQLHGQQLWVASGAKPTVYAHFYSDKAQAQNHPDTKGVQP